MKNISSNASAAAAGWDFQYNAGIVIMLGNIKEAKSVKIEGPTEDIEVLLSSNKKIYAQAKGIERYDDYKNVLAYFKKALRTLDNAWKTGDGDCLIYTTNSPRPFNVKESDSFFAGPPSYYKFEELPQGDRNKINKLYEDAGCSFPKEKLRVLVVGLHGDDDSTRYRHVESVVGKFLTRIGLQQCFWSERALMCWQVKFGRNATRGDRRRSITKEEMIWPLIVWLCCLDESDVRLSGLDFAEAEETCRWYKSIISDRAEDFRFVTKVLEAYDSYKTSPAHRMQSSADVTRSFLLEKWDDFKSDFDLRDVEEKILKTVVTLAVENVVRRRYDIARIKREVGLCE